MEELKDQPYAGARHKCIFCGKGEGRHKHDCPTLLYGDIANRHPDVILRHGVSYNEATYNGRRYRRVNGDVAVPPNEFNATHWAELPDGSTLFYKVGDETLLWLPLRKVWVSPGMVPYTLYSFDDLDV